MRFRRRKPFLNVLLDSGVDLLTSMRERMPDVGDLRDTVTNTYDAASDRVGRAAGALRGEEEFHVFRTIATLVIGVGIGVGIGLLIAPTTGEETRADLAEVASDLIDKLRPEATSTKTAKAATQPDSV
jgi:YtxH-like protein